MSRTHPLSTLIEHFLRSHVNYEWPANHSSLEDAVEAFAHAGAVTTINTEPAIAKNLQVVGELHTLLLRFPDEASLSHHIDFELALDHDVPDARAWVEHVRDHLTRTTIAMVQEQESAGRQDPDRPAEPE